MPPYDIHHLSESIFEQHRDTPSSFALQHYEEEDRDRIQRVHREFNARRIAHLDEKARQKHQEKFCEYWHVSQLNPVTIQPGGKGMLPRPAADEHVMAHGTRHRQAPNSTLDINHVSQYQQSQMAIRLDWDTRKRQPFRRRPHRATNARSHNDSLALADAVCSNPGTSWCGGIMRNQKRHPNDDADNLPDELRLPDQYPYITNSDIALQKHSNERPDLGRRTYVYSGAVPDYFRQVLGHHDHHHHDLN